MSNYIDPTPASMPHDADDNDCISADVQGSVDVRMAHNDSRESETFGQGSSIGDYMQMPPVANYSTSPAATEMDVLGLEPFPGL